MMLSMGTLVCFFPLPSRLPTGVSVVAGCRWGVHRKVACASPERTTTMVKACPMPFPTFCRFLLPSPPPPSPPATARPARTIGILKRDPLEQIPVDTRRKSWKKLPAPDLNQNQMGNRSTRSVTSRCSGSSSVPSDDDSFCSSQSCGSSLAEGVPELRHAFLSSRHRRGCIIKH
jgi:hypothetical protein